MKKIISFMLGLILLISQISLVSIFSFEKFISPESLTETVAKIDIPKALTTVNVNSNNEDESNKLIDQVDKIVLEDIYEIAAKGNLTKDKVDNIINSNVVKEFSANYITKVANYITTGEEKKITGKEITTIVKSNIDSIATDAGIKLDNDSKNAIVTTVDNYSDDIATLIPSPKDVVKNTNPDMIDKIQKLFSSEVKTILLVSVILSSILLSLLQLKKYVWMKWISLISMLSGVVICLLGYILIPTLNILLENQTQFMLNVLQTFADKLKVAFLLHGGILIAVSLVVLLVYEAIHRKAVDIEIDELAAEIKEEFESKQIQQ